MKPDYDEIAEKILQADAILIGASNGLSITEGLNLFADDEAFENLFGDYKRKYRLRRILDGFFYSWKTAEEDTLRKCRPESEDLLPAVSATECGSKPLRQAVLQSLE